MPARLGEPVHRRHGRGSSASKWFDVARLAGQLDGGDFDDIVDQRQAHGFLGGEVPAERAGRDVGDRGDLLDGGLLVTLPLAQLDGGVDQRRAGALLLPFPQAERASPDTSGTPGC